jgi:FkbM family methyltransferase
MIMNLRFILLRAFRLLPFLPRRLTERCTDFLLPLDPNNAPDGVDLNYPIMQVCFLGLSYRLDLNVHIEFHMYFNGVYDYRTVFLMRKIIARIDDAVCMDIGANIGNHMLPIAKLAKHVYAFEPNPVMMKKLTANLERNGIDNATLFNFGISSTNEELPFCFNSVNPGCGTFCVDKQEQNQEVPDYVLCVRGGDDVVSEIGLEKLDFVKIDVEGFECEVITGLKNTFEKFRPIVMFEFMGKASHEKFESMTKLYQFFPADYHLCALGTSMRSRYLGNNAFDKPKFFLYSKDFSNIVAFPENKYRLLFGRA